MSNPLVSVVITTYRREEELKRALESLVSQTYDNYEVILIDDNGDAEWNEKVKSIVDGITGVNIKLIVDCPNKGSAMARNEGIYVANGEYITFLDDDDVYLPEKIEKQVNYLDESGADFCITDLYLYNDKEVITDKRIRNYIKKTDKQSLLTYHLMYHMTGTDTLMFKTFFLQKIGGFPPIDVGDEFYLVLSAIENNCMFVYMPGCDVKAYVHGENGGISTGENKIKGENELYEKKKTYFNQVDTGTVRFIKMRHYAVLSVANKNCGKYWAVLMCLFRAFAIAPLGIIKLFFRHKR